jgi:hypothetical protein
METLYKRVRTICRIAGCRIAGMFWFRRRPIESRRRHLFAISCAQAVLPMFEQQFPEDLRPREAVKAAVKLSTPAEVGEMVSAADAVQAAVAAAAAATERMEEYWKLVS